MLEDGRYELRIDTGQVYALNNPTNPLIDNDGTQDGRVTAGFHQLVGDFDGDGAVDGGDRTDWLQHYGSELGQSLYDYAYDLNGDGIIDLFDYVIWPVPRAESSGIETVSGRPDDRQFAGKQAATRTEVRPMVCLLVRRSTR